MSTPFVSAVASGRSRITSNQVFAVFVFVFVELMFFSALFSSYYVIRRGRVSWDMPASVILPSPSAAFNILILSMSGFFMIMALRAMKAKASDRSSARSHAIKGFGLGLLFFIFQLYLLLKVRSMGLTMDGSLFGACFNLMIGAHLLHVLAGLAVMAKIIFNPKVAYASFKALVLFWSFLVLVWPVLYVQLYR